MFLHLVVSLYLVVPDLASISLNLFGRMCTFVVKMYSIVCVPLNTPPVLYLHHHRAASDGWGSANLCDECSEEFQSILEPFVGTCTLDTSCSCNVCLRQPPSLRNLASLSLPLHFQFIAVDTVWQNIVPRISVCCGIADSFRGGVGSTYSSQILIIEMYVCTG